MSVSTYSRRDLLVKGSTLSVAGLGLLAGVSGKAFAADGSETSGQDVDILNVILGTEHEGIAAYEIVLGRKLLHAEAAKNAHLFQDHHKTHRDILIGKIKTLGGTPAQAKQNDEYANDLDTVNVKSQKDALQLIVKLELGAANAYIGMLPSTNDHELIKVASRIAADEVLHWTSWTSLLHNPLPPDALSFGA